MEHGRRAEGPAMILSLATAKSIVRALQLGFGDTVRIETIMFTGPCFYSENLLLFSLLSTARAAEEKSVPSSYRRWLL